MAAPAFRAAGTAVYTANSVATPTVLSPTKSGSTVNGDLMLLVVESIKITATCSTPTGWFLLTGFPVTSGTAAGGRMWVFARVADGGANDAPAPSLGSLDTGTSGSSCGARIISFSAALADQAGPLPTKTDTAATTSFTLPGITTNVDNAMAVGIAMKVNDTAHTFTVTTFTERSDDHTTTGTGHGTEVSSLLKTPAGATGDGTVTPSTVVSSRVLATSLALAPKDTTPIADSISGFVPGYPAGKVTAGQTKPNVSSTYVSKVQALTGVSQLLDDCWDQVPDANPQFTRVLTRYSPFTLSTIRSFGVWVNRDAVNNAAGDAIFTGGGIAEGLNSGVYPILQIGNGGANPNDIVFNPQIVVLTAINWAAAFPGSSQWVFLGLVYNETTQNASLYVNGSLVSTQAVGGTGNWGGTAPNYLHWGGNTTSNSSFDGKLYGAFLVEGDVTAAQWLDLMRQTVPLGTSDASAAPTLALTAKATVALETAAAQSAATLAVTATTRVPLGTSVALATSTLALTAPALLTLSAAAASSTATLAMSAAATLTLASAAVSTTTLNVSALTQIPLGASAASSAPTLALRAQTAIPLQSSAALSTSSLALNAPATVTLQASAAQSAATLAVKAQTSVPLGTSAAQSTATLDLSVPTTDQFARPTSDIALAGWVVSPLWSKLDEVVADDADLITGAV